MERTYYGSVFRVIRKQKKLPLSYFEKFGIKKSNLSKFERGNSMMGFEKIYIMLEAMDISLEEYEILLNRFTPSFPEQFFQELEHAEISQDFLKLNKLYKEFDEESNTFLSLIIKSKMTLLPSQEIQQILDFLYSAHYWKYFELELLDSILDVIKLKDIIEIFKIFEDRIDKYRNLFKYTRKINQVSYHFVLILAVKKEKKLAERILIKTVYNKHIDFYSTSLRKIALGFMEYTFGDKDLGLLQINDSLLIIKSLGGNDLYKYYRSKLNLYINQNSDN